MKKLFYSLLFVFSTASYASGLTAITDTQEAVCLSRIEHIAIKDHGGKDGTFKPTGFSNTSAEKTLTYSGEFSITNSFGITQNGTGACYITLNEAKEQYIYSTNVEMDNYFYIFIAVLLAPLIALGVFFGLKKYDELHPQPEKKKRTRRTATTTPQE